MCLNQERVYDGLCCDNSLKWRQMTEYCRWQTEQPYCANGHDHRNRIIQEFVCPATAGMCETDPRKVNVNVQHTGRNYGRHVHWDVTVPNRDFDWHCKYIIQADNELVKKENPDDIGYLYVEGQ